MTAITTEFTPGSVEHNLAQLAGVWHDRIDLYNLDGSPLDDDSLVGSGTPGPGPFENLVYVDFNGRELLLTNVHIKGREIAAKTFSGRIRDSLLVFDPLGPGAYENIGMSGGPGILTFNARELDQATGVYMEPDFIILTGPDSRVRHTVLYRNGIAVRTLTARGDRVGTDCSVRHAMDARGAEGPVHETPFSSNIWSHLVDEAQATTDI